MSFLNWVDRIGRPVFIRIMLPIALVWLCWEIVDIFRSAARRAIETGQPIPDLTGGLAPIILSIVSMVGPVMLDQFTRHRERTHQIARGEAPSPFGQSPASQSDVPGGGLVNNEALR